jgi:large subunit ribosomal protein L10
MGMRLDQKQAIADELHGRLRDAGIVYLADFTGLDVEAMGQLRARLLEQGIEFRVVKNTLTRRALEGLDYPDLTEHFIGPTALVMGSEDPVFPAKVVRDFAKEHDNRPVLKAGVVERRQVSAEEISRLAETPPRDQVLASIAGGLTASVSGIAGALRGLIGDITYMIGEVAKKGEQ